MRIGVIGTGALGGAAIERFEDAGHEVLAGDSQGGAAEAAEFGEVVLLALPFGAHTDLPVDELAGKVVIDAMNYDPARDGHIAALDAGEITSSELLARHLAGDASVVKALNTMDAHTFEEDGRPAGAHDRLALFVAGDDELAKRIVLELIDEIGFDPVDTGSLAGGGRQQQPGGPLFGTAITALEAQERFGGTER
jgi:8-hydroxy-5-deazaflavin:NADPH oxidoreductase